MAFVKKTELKSANKNASTLNKAVIFFKWIPIGNNENFLKMGQKGVEPDKQLGQFLLALHLFSKLFTVLFIEFDGFF